MNKKRYWIILILLLFIFLVLFTFANPLGDGDANDNRVLEEIEEDDLINKEEEKEQTTTVDVPKYNEHGVNVDKIVVEDNSYELALNAVIKAEVTLEKDNYDIASDLVDKVTDKDKKAELEERLEDVLNSINVRELVETLVKMTKSSTTKLELEDARKYNNSNEVFDRVSELTDEILKETLEDALDSIAYLLDDTTAPTINIEDGAILNKNTEIKVEDENEVTLMLNDTEIENNYKATDGVYELTVIDAAFNEVTIKFTIDTIAPTATINYSKGELTNEDVVVTLNPSEDIKVTNNDGKLEYTFKENGEFTFEFEDIAGNKGSATVVVDYIDKTKPEVEVAYSNEKATNENVIVKLTLSEEIKEVEGWTLSENKMTLTKELDANEEGKVTVEDLAGNTIEVEYSVNNIDKELPEATVTYSTEEFINGNVTVTVEVTEEIKEVEGWTLSEDKKVLTKEFTANEEGTIKVKDLAGNTLEVNYSVKNIDKSYPTVKNVEDGKHYKEVTPVIEDENIESIKLNGFDFTSGTTIKINGNYTLVATDKAGNTTTVEFTVDSIKPLIFVLDKLSFIRGDLIPIKPVIIDANLDKVVITLDGENINYKDGDQLTEPGLYEITATDKAGNTSVTTFTMDNNGPEIYTEQEVLGQKVDVKLSGISLGQLMAFKEVNLKVREDNFDPKSIIVLKKSNINLPFDYSLPTYNKIDYTYGDTITEEGEYIVLAADKALNISFGKFTIDRTNPVIVGVENGKYYKEAEFKVEDATTVTTIVSKKQFGIYLPTVLTSDDIITEAGEYKIESVDAAGNKATPVEFVIDPEDPTITGVTNNYIYIDEVTPVVSDDNLDSIVVTKDGNTIESQTTYTEDGVYVVTAIDKATNSTTVSFEIDKNALKIENVENGKYYQTSVEPKITNRGEITIKLMKDGSLVDYKNKISDAGNYILTVVDQYDNKVEVKFAVDEVAPTIHVTDKQIAATDNGIFNLFENVVVTDDVDTNPELTITEITHTNGTPISKDVTEISTTSDWEGTYTITYHAVDKSGRDTTEKINIIVFLSDISINLDLSGLENIYNGKDQTDKIKACVYDKNGAEVSCDTTNDIDIKVVNLITNEDFVKNAGDYEITASVKNKPSEYTYDVYQTLTYKISPKEVNVEYTLVGEGETTEYDGNKKTYAAEIDTFEGRKPIATYTTTDSDAKQYEIDVTGMYTDPNYIIGNTKTTVEITKAKIDVVFSDINSDGMIEPGFKNQSGDSFDNIINPTIEYYKVKYRSIFGFNTPVGVDKVDNMKTAGTYVAAVDFVATDNYELNNSSVADKIIEFVMGFYDIKGQPKIYEVK